MDWIGEPGAWIGLLTLVSLEIVLGIDNVVFITILADKLPESQRDRARQVGIGLAVISRLLLLLSISWIIRLENPLFTIPFADIDISGRDLILIAGGLFLIGKATHEIHAKLEGEEHGVERRTTATFTGVIVQVILLDLVFSLDSVITAVGMVDEIMIMVIAVITAAAIMLFASGPISRFVFKHPTLKMLALSFLLLIGLTLLVEGFHRHIPKGYIYAAMGFSLLVELLNLRVRRHKEPVPIHQPVIPERADEGKRQAVAVE